MRNGRITIMLQLVVAIPIVLFSAQQVRAQDPISDLDTYIRQVMQDWEAPGVAVAVVKDDRIVYLRGFGVREIGIDVPVDEHTVFSIASTSKAFTTAALGLLVDEGRLQWDDHVTDHLVGFELADPWVTRELTVRDLLSHRSGLPRGDQLWYGSPFSREEVLERVRLLEPASSFRSRYGYQNIMFTTAGEIIPAVTDTSWGDFLEARIFGPLGMRSSSTTLAEVEAHDNVATPHGKPGRDLTAISWRDWDNLGGAGAINSSAADMAQWMRLQLGNGEYDGRRFLSERVIREMRSPQTIVPLSRSDREFFPETHFALYGLGWRLNDYRGRLVARHGGALDGFRTHIALLPEENLGVVALTNVNESSVPLSIVWHVIDQYLGPQEKDWNQLYLAAAEKAQARTDSLWTVRESERLLGTTPTHALAEFAGTYEHDIYGQVTITFEDERLVITAGPFYIGDLVHWHLNTFRVGWRDLYLGQDYLGFILDRMGRIAAVDIEGFGRFERLDDPDPPTGG
ncbi:serine hydrolase [Gemmatimonadota bacterium]